MSGEVSVLEWAGPARVHLAEPTTSENVAMNDEYRAKTIARFWSKVNKTETCWLWTGALNGGGYGTFDVAMRTVVAHRFSYETSRGNIPSGLDCDHLCRVRSCVRPDHLECVTSLENTMRGISPVAINAKKTHCVHGHEFTKANTRVWLNPRTGRTQRNCIECERLYYLNSKSRKAAMR